MKMSISRNPTWSVSTRAVVVITPRADSPTTGRTRISNSGITRCGARQSRIRVKPTSRHQCKRVSTTAMKIAGTRTSANGIRYCHQLEPPLATIPRMATSVPASMVKMPNAKRSGPRPGGRIRRTPAAATIRPMPSLTSQSRPGRRCAEAGSAIARYDGPGRQTPARPHPTAPPAFHARLSAPGLAEAGGGKWRSGRNLNGLRPANEGKAPVLPEPEVHERHHPDDGDDDVPRDSAVDVERSVQQRHAEVGDENTPGQTQVALARGMEDGATKDHRPETVTEWGQHASTELRENHGRERQGELLTLDDEERGQRVTATLERRKAEADRGPEHHPVTGRIGTETHRKHDDRRAFDELLDQSNLEVAAETGAIHQPEFEKRCRQDPQDPGDEERRHDTPRRQRRTRIVVEVPGDGRDRHEETAK